MPLKACLVCLHALSWRHKQKVLLTEVYEEFAIAFALVLRQCSDAWNIVFLLAVLLFTEVANEMTTSLVILS